MCQRIALGWLAIFVGLLVVSFAAAADEEELIRQYSELISKLNADKFAEARQDLDAFEKVAKEVKATDPAYKRAQELLKQTPDLRLGSYRNSAINSKNQTGEAIRSVKLADAARHLSQFSADTAELAKLRPADKSYQQQFAEAKKQLAQVEVVQALLEGKTARDEQIAAAAVEKPKRLYQSAPGFALPRADQPQWTSPLDKSGQAVVVQIFQADHETAPFAALTARAMEKQYAGQGLTFVSVSLDV